MARQRSLKISWLVKIDEHEALEKSQKPTINERRTLRLLNIAPINDLWLIELALREGRHPHTIGVHRVNVLYTKAAHFLLVSKRFERGSRVTGSLEKLSARE